MSSTSSAGDARIIADRLTFAPADGRVLFDDISLSFGRERTGLVGPNGSGKTTLVRLLAGELLPTAGRVQRTAHVAVLPQEFVTAADATLASLLHVDQRMAALRRLDAGDCDAGDLALVDDDWDLPARIEAVLARFELDHLALDRPVGALSGGEATRVGLARLALGRPDFLLLDEPTNHLDAARRQALYDFVDDWTGGLLCVSHDRALLQRMDRIVELSGLGVRAYGGNYDVFVEQRDLEDAAAGRELSSARAALRAAERRARAVRERQARRDAQGRRSRSTSNMPKILLNARRANAEATGARVRAVTEREVEEQRVRAAAARERVEERERPRFALPTTGLAAGRTVLAMENVSVQFEAAPAPVLDGVSLRIEGPERVAITGPNGSGKTTLLRVATGGIEPTAGTVRRLAPGEVAYLAQGKDSLDDTASVLDNFRATHPDLDPTEARYALARFLFSDEAALQHVGTLSGGQRMRAALACALGGTPPPSLIVLDEPTNHLDLDATEALEAALRDYDGAILVVSHDPAFLEAIGVEREVRLDGVSRP